MICKQSLLVIDTPKSCSECEFQVDMYGYIPVCVNDLTLDLGELGCKEIYETQRHPKCQLQYTTELLEALNFINSLPTGEQKRHKLYVEAYNKLHKALSGNNED